MFTCSTLNRLQEAHITTLANNGCIGIIEGVQQGTTNAAISAGKKRGLHHAPYRATTVGASLFNGATLSLYVTYTHQLIHIYLKHSFRTRTGVLCVHTHI